MRAKDDPFIGLGTFTGLADLKAIHVDPNNAKFSSLDGVLFDKKQTNSLNVRVAKSAVYSSGQRHKHRVPSI